MQRERAARKESETLLEDKSRELYFANQELEESLNGLKQAQSQLVQSEKMASVGQLAAGIAHEINNPVGFISSNLATLKEYIEELNDYFGRIDALLANTPGAGEIKDAVGAIRRDIDFDYIVGDIGSLVAESLDGAARVKQIVSDLSEFSHINGPDEVQEDINELLEKTLNLARNQLKYDIDIVQDFGDGCSIYCNGAKLGQVFLNLIINAIHAMEANTDKRQLTLLTRIEQQDLRVEISDNGCGIEQEKIARIFDPFYTTKDVGKGTGLGLHIVQDIVTSHNGSITVSSTPGVGTTFSIVLPANAETNEIQEAAGL